jgi:hypothetical protein
MVDRKQNRTKFISQKQKLTKSNKQATTTEAESNKQPKHPCRPILLAFVKRLSLRDRICPFSSFRIVDHFGKYSLSMFLSLTTILQRILQVLIRADNKHS